MALEKDPLTCTVRECMTPQVLYAYEDQSIEDLAGNFASNKVHRFPVVDRQKTLVGVVSIGDLARHANDQHDHELTGQCLCALKRAA